MQILTIAKTRTSLYHPQCDGQVERMNRTIIELLKLNVSNPIDNWDLERGLCLMTYRSAVQSSTGYTSYYLLYGKEMRLPLDIMYRPPGTEQSRTECVRELRTSLQDAYVTVRDKLQLAHQRQKDYYDRRTHGERFKTGESVWLWSPVIPKGVAPKFHEPWTGPFKVTKRLSDVTYKILDVKRKPTKIVHFDRLKKSTVKPRAHVLSESELEGEVLSETESTDSETSAAKTSPKPIQHKKSLSRNMKNTKEICPGSADTSSTLASQVAPAENQPTDIAGQLADSSKRRVSERSNKGKTPSRFATTGYLPYVCLIIFLFCTSAINAILVSPLSEVDTEEMPIVDNEILSHLLERAILLSDYQFLIVSYKILPPKTSCGKFLCGGIYNATEILAPSWYLDWKKN